MLVVNDKAELTRKEVFLCSVRVDSTLVWEKFTIGYFHVKIVCGKIVSFLGHPMNSFNNTLLRLKLCSLSLCIIILNLTKPLWSISAYCLTV